MSLAQGDPPWHWAGLGVGPVSVLKAAALFATADPFLVLLLQAPFLHSPLDGDFSVSELLTAEAVTGTQVLLSVVHILHSSGHSLLFYCASGSHRYCSRRLPIFTVFSSLSLVPLIA